MWRQWLWGPTCLHRRDKTNLGKANVPTKKQALVVETQTVYQLLDSSKHSFNNKDLIILDREHRWYETGVKELIESNHHSKNGQAYVTIGQGYNSSNLPKSRRGLTPTSPQTVTSPRHSFDNLPYWLSTWRSGARVFSLIGGKSVRSWPGCGLQ